MGSSQSVPPEHGRTLEFVFERLAPWDCLVLRTSVAVNRLRSAGHSQPRLGSSQSAAPEHGRMRPRPAATTPAADRGRTCGVLRTGSRFPPLGGSLVPRSRFRDVHSFLVYSTESGPNVFPCSLDMQLCVHPHSSAFIHIQDFLGSLLQKVCSWNQKFSLGKILTFRAPAVCLSGRNPERTSCGYKILALPLLSTWKAVKG